MPFDSNVTGGGVYGAIAVSDSSAGASTYDTRASWTRPPSKYSEIPVTAANASADRRLERPVSAFDVAAYVLQRIGPMQTMKLHKLLYYAQAWSLVWDGDRLFPERIEAWANGPVIPDVFAAHQGRFRVSAQDLPGNALQLTDENRETIDAVLGFYGDKPPHWLSELSHQEAPWRQAREGIPDGERGNNEISLQSMLEYYSSL